MKSLSPLFLLAAAISLPCAPAAHAYDLPAVNLGFTSFVDGAPPAGPGFYFQQYYQWHSVSALRDGGGNPLLPATPSLDVHISLSQFVFQSDLEILPRARFGMNLMLPVVEFSLADNPFLNARSGVGDLLFGPYLQWDPVMGANGPLFMQRVELQVIVPTGRYDPARALNPSANHFSFNPYWAATWFFAPRWELSWRLHYLWNGSNRDRDIRPGQAVHANFAISYDLIAGRLRLGLNGYALRQISASRQAGVSLPGRERVIAIGPGMLYSFSRANHIFLNLYSEFSVRNRPESWVSNLRWVHHF
jgi:hypothetical protein